jgi:hypothetical protein
MENRSPDVRVGLDHLKSGKELDGLRNVRGNDDGISESGRPRVWALGRCALEPLKRTMLGYWKNAGHKISTIKISAIKLLAITFLAVKDAGRLER